MLASSSLISVLLLASTAMAQRATVTLPWANGDTIVVSTGTNALGAPTTATLSTVVAGVAATTTARGATTTARAANPAADDDGDEEATTTAATTTRGRATTTQGRGNVQGISTDSYEPMRTTTYWLDPGDGVWTAFTWTAPTTTLPSVPTANVPAGTIQDYQSYQSNVNSIVLESAQNALASSTRNAAGRAQPLYAEGVMGGWVTMVVGAVGAGLGVLAL